MQMSLDTFLLDVISKAINLSKTVLFVAPWYKFMIVV